jgi:hypothetical protein
MVPKRKKSLVWKGLAAVIALVALTLAGCYSAPIMPPTGILFSNVDAPGSLAITGQDLGSRKGEASCRSILGLIAWGDCSAKAAADDGGISNLKQLDYTYLNVIVVYQRLTTIAYGD